MRASSAKRDGFSDAFQHSVCKSAQRNVLKAGCVDPVMERLCPLTLKIKPSTLSTSRLRLPAGPSQWPLVLQWHCFPFLFLQFGDSNDKQPLLTAAECFSLSATTG